MDVGSQSGEDVGPGTVFTQDGQGANVNITLCTTCALTHNTGQ